MGVLANPISQEKLKIATKILENRKGTGFDIIRNEILVPLVKLHLKLVLRAINAIIRDHVSIGKDWLRSLVTAI